MGNDGEWKILEKPAVGRTGTGRSVDQSASPTESEDEWKTIGDSDLVRATNSGDHVAFEELIRRHRPTRLNLIRKMLRGRCPDDHVEEVEQETQIKIFRGLRGFRQEAAFTTWQYRIVVNQVNDHVRKCDTKRLDISIEDFVDVLEANGMLTPEQQLLMKELLDLCENILDEEEMKLFKLWRDGATTVEMAVALETTPGSVRVRVFRMKHKLMAAIRKYT